MRFKAILADIARKRYPLSIMIIVVGILTIPFPYLFIHFGLELNDAWWTVLAIGLGIILGSALIGLGSLVEDIHDISMHTVGYDLELGDLPDDEADEGEDAVEPEEAEESAEAAKD